MKWLAALMLLLLVMVPSAARAQPATPPPAQPQTGQPTTLRVATRVVKPFVFEDGGNLTGFSIDLWPEIANILGARTDFVTKPTVNDLLDATQTGEADLAISAISITEERERDWDFSLPMFDAGLQIMVPDTGDSGSSLGHLLTSLLNPAFIPLIVFGVVAALIVGHIIWFFERRREHSLLENRPYFPGVLEGIFWGASTLATQAESMPKSPIARIVAICWMFTAVLFIAFFTASVTSSLTVQSLRSDIQGPDDLPGKQVATVTGSTSAEYLSQHNIKASGFATVDDAIAALEKGDEDAVVYDAPVLQYVASHEGKGKVAVVGDVFRKESYGILFPTNSPLRKRVNEALLHLREDGTYDRLQTKYFGQASGAGK